MVLTSGPCGNDELMRWKILWPDKQVYTEKMVYEGFFEKPGGLLKIQMGF